MTTTITRPTRGLAILDEVLETVEKKNKEKKDGDSPPKEKYGKKPPAEGPCKRCGKDKPLNRLFLCYMCWVKVNLEKSGWREGMPHPSSCECVGSKVPHEGRGPQG